MSTDPGPQSESCFLHTQFIAPQNKSWLCFKRNHILLVDVNAILVEMVLRRERIFEVTWPALEVSCHIRWHYVTFIFVLSVLMYKNNKQTHITTYYVTRMKPYICICYLNVLITVLFTWCVFECACVLLPRSHKRGMIVVKLMPNCGKINMFKPSIVFLNILRRPPFRRRHFQIHFLDRKCMIFAANYT